MRQKLLLTMLLLLSIVAPVAAFADSFTIKPVDLELGKTATLEFNLENTHEYYGFQADVTLPEGITVDAVTLADAPADGEYNVNYKTVSNGSVRIAAFSAKHKALITKNGVLVNMKVEVADTYKGGEIKVSNIIFTDKDNQDVKLDGSTTTLGVKVTSITLSNEAVELMATETATLTATVKSGEIVIDKTVTWKSDNPKVATVNENGIVKAVAVGDALITASYGEDVTASCRVTVKRTAVKSITLSNTDLILKEGTTAKLTATVDPKTATDTSITWSTSDDSVATVSDSGEVKALKEGEATITATSNSDKEVTASCKVTVNANIIEVESISIGKTELTLTIGGKETLTATLTPTNPTVATVTWTSDDTSIATVVDGEVTAIGVGTATITASSSNGKTATCKVTVNPILATNVTLSETAASLKVGETVTLTATVAPDNTTDKTIVWTSSDATIASVDANGKVIAKALGEATITATCGSVSATCKVSVVKTPIETITLDNTTLSLTEGDTATLTATVAPDDATYKTVTWTSSDTKIATVDADGKVTAVSAGTATITATADGKSVTCTVTVTAKTVAVTGVTLNKTTLSMTEGDTETLTATVAPADATDKTITWSSSDETVATVDANGNVTAKSKGTATITATAGGKTATCSVTVSAKEIPVKGITLSKTTATITEGKSLTLTVTIEPTNATDKKVTWTSSNETVATVDNNGKITAVAPGEATITAKVADKSASCVVTVEKDLSNYTAAEVKMTYVDRSNPDQSFGEIATGETARSGFNEIIKNNEIGFPKTTWGVEFITYLQVKIPEVQGTITGATLTFEASEGSDGKRTQTYGVGYNNSVWSSDMTYNTADKSIILMGDTQSGSQKYADKFKTFSFDITEAVKHADENGLITVLIYETVAAGGYIKNPTATFAWTSEPTYQVTFTETNDVEGVKVTVDGTDVTNGVSLVNGTYNFTATAPTYKKYEGEFTVAGADIDVKFAMTPKATWNYTVKNNVNDEVKTGTCLEGEPASVAYNRYILAADGTVWKKDPCGGDKKLEYNYTFTPDDDNFEDTLEYAATEMTDGLYFIEAEDIEGMTATDKGNAGVRASNSLGGYASDPVAFHTLKPGKYIIKIAASGSKDKVLTVKGDEETFLAATTTGSWNEFTSEEIAITSDTELTFEGAAEGYPLDYILITGKVNSVADYKVIFVDVDENGKEIKDAVTESGIVGTTIELSEEYTKDFVKDGIPYIYEGIDPENPTIAEDGTTVVTVKFHKQNEVTYTVKFVDQDGNTIKESESRTGDAGSAATISDEDKKDIVINDVTYVYAGDNTEGLKYSYDGKTEIVITYNKVVGYTIKFVDESGNEIQEKECTGAIGSEIDLSEYVNGVTVDGKVYFYVNASYEPEGNTVADGKVVTITLESAAKLPYIRTESTWSEADLTDWVSADGITKSINNGLNVTWGNTGWALTKDVNFTENSIVTLTASMKGGNTGRGDAYEYLELGGVQVRLDGQNKVGTVVIGTETFTLSGDARGGSVDIEMIINQASKKATVTVSGSCTGTNTGKITEALPNKVVFGYHKNGSLSGDRTATLKSISISEEFQLVTTADYTINYVCNGEIIKSEEGTTAIDDEITAASTLTVDDQKYYVADGATTSMTISGDHDNVLNVNMRKAYVYNYIVKNNVTEDVIKGSVIEGDNATVAFSKYIIAEDGTVWTKDAINKEYNYTFTPDAIDYEIKLEYNATETTDGIFFAEAEDIDGMTEATGYNADIRCSNAAGGYSAEAVTLYTLPAGTYKVKLGVWGNAGATFVAKAGEETILTAETQGYWFEAVSDEFTVETETALTFEGAQSSKPLDYVLITGTLKEIVNSVVIDNTGIADKYTIGDTFKLKATVDSENSATEPQVTWTSSNPKVATVDKSGNVTVVKAGNVKITATYGGKSASCNLKCYPQVGDANWDGNIDIADAVDISNYVVGKQVTVADSNWDEAEWTEFYKTGANANNDEEGKITFADASATVTIALAQPIVPSTQNRVIAAYDDETQDALVIGGISAANGRISIPVTLDNSMEYVALQADIILPEGMNVEVKEGCRVADSHIMATHKFADNHIRVALYNLGNTAFADNNAPIIEIIADGMISDNEEITISNIIAADTDANRFVLASKAAVTTGVEAIEFDSNATVKVYDLNGRYISDKVEGLEQGFYIIRQGDNAKKVRIR